MKSIAELTYPRNPTSHPLAHPYTLALIRLYLISILLGRMDEHAQMARA